LVKNNPAVGPVITFDNDPREDFLFFKNHNNNNVMIFFFMCTVLLAVLETLCGYNTGQEFGIGLIG
jgi:hypothetical protein